MAFRILFVCTGNICRSPTAQGVLEHMLEKAGTLEKFEVDSAGLIDFHVGEPPDERSVYHSKLRGYAIGHQRARKLERSDFETFDLIVAIANSHLASLRAISPAQHRHKIKLLLDFSEDMKGQDVPDPYYGDEKEFEEVIDLTEKGIKGLLRVLP